MIFIVVSILLMTLYAREGGSGVLHNIQAAIENTVAPIKIVGTTVESGFEGAGDAIGDATASPDTLSALKEQNAELNELAAQGEEYRLEAQRLESLLNLKDTYDIDGVAAHVIGRSTDAWNQTVSIDVGSSSGVDVGLTVMGPSGVIGQVISVSPGYSTVRLLSDPNSGAAALVQSSRAEGIVRGSLTGVLYLENVDAGVVLNVGDVVLTSGLGGSYTRGLLIGTIVRIEGNADDGSQSIVISPNEEISSLEDVMVVFSARGDEDLSASDADAQNNEDGYEEDEDESDFSGYYNYDDYDSDEED